MNAEERKQLRDKHYPVRVHFDKVACASCTKAGPHGAKMVEYPCEVIQVLDAWEATLD